MTGGGESRVRGGYPWGRWRRCWGLYQEKYFDFNMRHFHEKLREEHGLRLSYTWVKLALQGAGLVNRRRKRGLHRQRRPRRPLPGMRPISPEPRSTSAAETVLAALREVVEQQGIFCALYSDRAVILTRKAGEPVDRQRLTQAGRALRELGICGGNRYCRLATGSEGHRQRNVVGKRAPGRAPNAPGWDVKHWLWPHTVGRYSSEGVAIRCGGRRRSPVASRQHHLALTPSPYGLLRSAPNHFR